ncbi:unnamed protein product [Callosobruchus maculatus]|uniref:Uncharacterized protein n=1 Tax=Callosobruchus maculatus TaxID=64391 RepID=A0A653BYW6_CALMS|nr:unnamed protein product [Callosobruchus maculatus]
MRPLLWCIVLSILALRGTKGCNGGCQHDSCCGGCRSSCSTVTCMQTCCSGCCCKSSTPWPSTPSPTSFPPTSAPVPPLPPYSPSNSNTNVNNNINSTLDVTINNHINVENRVYVPISINNSNVQSVSIVDEDNNTNSNVGPTVVPPYPPWPTPPWTPSTTTHPWSTWPTPNTTSPVTSTTPVTSTAEITPPSRPPYTIIRIPVPYYIYKTYPIPVSYRVSTGCCIVIRPCVTYGCQSHRHHCGTGCLGRVMYEPINPCHAGCYRRSSGHRQICWSEESCARTKVDCNGCNSDFFETYGGYQKCGGCFSGMPFNGLGTFSGGGLGGYDGMAPGGGGGGYEDIGVGGGAWRH